MGPKSKPAKEGDVRHQQEEEQVDTTSTRPTEGEGPSGTGSPAEGVVSELASMMKIMLQAQEVRESRWEKVVQSQDQRWKVMSHQFQLLQGEVGNILSSGSSRANTLTGDSRETRFKDPKLQPLSKEDDIEHFLATFERVAVTCRWPESTWTIRIVPLLTGKAHGAFVAMDMEDTDDYTLVKEAIMKKYNIRPETYRQKFCTSEILPGETPRELYVRLKEYLQKWIRPEKHSVKEITEMFILEQFMDMLGEDMAIWIREHDPKTAEEAARLAEVFQSARLGTRGPSTSRRSSAGRKSDGGDEKRGQSYGRSTSYNRWPDGTRQDGNCFHCGKPGHTRQNCQEKKTQDTNMCYAPRPHTQHAPNSTGHSVQVLVNGEAVKALVDTGSSQTLVHQSLIPLEECRVQPPVKVCCVYGDVKSYPTAEIFLTVSGQTFFMSVAVAPQLPYKVVLGHDLPILCDLIPQVKHCNAVTRAQRVSELRALPFAEDELVPDVESRGERKRLSRQEKRRQKITVEAGQEKQEWTQPSRPLEMDIPTNIVELQRQDKTLELLFQKATGGVKGTQSTISGTQEARYILKNDILYQVKGECENLVVPGPIREKVMTLAHSIPWSGHLGKDKTLARIGSRFSWPNMYTDVSSFVRACPECQLTSGRAVPRAHLHSLPIIDTPFSRIGMDIVGPLERSKGGYRYILVLCDYATRYPEAFPLKNIKARQVANCLVQLFSRVGVPREVLTDQGTNFLSTLLRQVYSLLGIKGIKTTPYHPQTDGLVERFNRTLKTMLRRFVSQTGKDWDEWLPYLLFAYREVPQASTGFSPFELLYGRQVRGPWDLLKELWEGPKEENQNVALYVIQMRNRLEEMSALAHQNMELAQKKTENLV